MNPRVERARWLPWLAAGIVALVAGASLRWAATHPYGFNWDEALYINQLQADLARWHDGGFIGLFKAWLTVDPARPPAYRILAFPFAAAFGASPVVLRSVALLFRTLSIALVYAGTRRVAGASAGAIASIAVALSPDIIFFGTAFYTEFSIYLATAGVCCFLMLAWDEPAPSGGVCIGLGVSLGIGALAKASFAAIAGPLIVVAFALSVRRRIRGPGPQFLVVASGIGALIAFPWWLRNHGSALRYADYAAHYSASSLGVPGIRTTGLYAARFLLEGTGVPLAFVGIAIVAAAVAGLWRARNTLRLTPQVVAAWCLVLAAAPTCLLPLATQNQVIYHASQAVIPLAMGLAILAVDQGWAVSPVKFAVLDATIAIQAALTMAPVFVREEFSGLRTPWTALAAWEQWDWNQLRTLLLATGMTQPSIGYLGAMSVLNPPQIAYPWVRNGERAPDVTWMWRAESGPADLDALVASAGKYDVIVTCPELTAQDRPGENAYNQHNAEFAARLGAAPGFRPPLHLRMGRFHSTDLWVYVRR